MAAAKTMHTIKVLSVLFQDFNLNHQQTPYKAHHIALPQEQAVPRKEHPKKTGFSMNSRFSVQPVKSATTNPQPTKLTKPKTQPPTRIEKGLNWMKCKAGQCRHILHYMQIVTGVAALYCAVSVVLSTILQDPSRALANSFTVVTLVVTGITSLVLAKRRAWLKITPPEQSKHH